MPAKWHSLPCLCHSLLERPCTRKDGEKHILGEATGVATGRTASTGLFNTGVFTRVTLGHPTAGSHRVAPALGAESKAQPVKSQSGGAFHRQGAHHLDGLSFTSRLVSQGSMGMGPTRGFEPEQVLVFNWKQLRGGPASDLGATYCLGRRKEKTHLEEGDQDAEKEGTQALMMNLWKKGDARSCEMTVFRISVMPSPGRTDTCSACS